MRSIVCCLFLVAATAAAWATPGVGTVDARMQGSVQVAAPSLATGWFSNPAALADLNASGPASTETPMRNMRSEAAVGLEVSGNEDNVALTWGGNMPESALGLGLGAGWMESSWGREIGVGLGIKLPVAAPLAVGISAGLAKQDYHGSDNELVFDLGLRGAIPTQGTQDVAVYYGLVMRDATDRYYRAFDLGLSATFSQKFTLGADLVDISDEHDRSWRLGARYDLPTLTPVSLGAGLNDGDLALGFEVGLPKSSASSNMDVKFGLAWEDGNDDSWLIGARAAFGL
jgi:hypothetical protein